MNPNRSSKIILAALFAAQSFLAVAQTTNVVVPQDLPKFISQRNIFNPYREPNNPNPLPPRIIRTNPQPIPVRNVESFTLVGVIGYSEGKQAGVYAFFDGTSQDYHKTAQLNDGIANFRIVDIAADSVTLMSDTNSTTVLRIGDQLHNDGVGHWLSANGIAARYGSTGYGNGRNGRNGFGNGNNGYGNNGRRRNGFGNGNNGYGNGNNGNYNRGRNNNYGGTGNGTGNSQPDDQNMNFQNDNSAPDDNSPPDNNMAPPPPDDNAAPDSGSMDNSITPPSDQSAATSGDSSDPIEKLRAQRAAELNR